MHKPFLKSALASLLLAVALPSHAQKPSLPLFFSEMELLDSTKHAKLGLSQAKTNYSFASKATIIPVVANEVGLAIRHYPLVFVQEANAAAPTLVALVGLQADRNLFVSAEGDWRADTYIPAWVRRYPFYLVRSSQEKVSVAFDPSAQFFKGKDLKPLFKNGEPTDTLNAIVKFQGEYEIALQRTAAMVKALQEAGVMEQALLSIGAKSQEKDPRRIGGFLMINEAKLRELSAESLVKLQQANALPLAYAQLLSMSNLPSLSASEKEKTPRK